MHVLHLIAELGTHAEEALEPVVRPKAEVSKILMGREIKKRGVPASDEGIKLQSAPVDEVIVAVHRHDTGRTLHVIRADADRADFGAHSNAAVLDDELATD